MARRRGDRSPMVQKGTDTDSTEKAIHVTDHVFSSPSPFRTGLVIMVLSLFLGLMFEGHSVPYSTFQSFLAVFVIPGLLAAMISVPVAKGLGGHLYLRRSMLLVSVSQLVMMGMWLFWAIMGLFTELPFKPMALLVLAFPFFVWHTVLSATSDNRAPRTVWSSSLHAIFGLAGYHMMYPFSSGDLLLAAGIMVVILMSVSIFTNTARAPIQRVYDWDGLVLLKDMLAHWTEGASEGVIGMERFFDSFAVKAKVPFHLLAFRSIKQDRVKGVMIVPGAHPGPFGVLAGSNMPDKLRPFLAGGKGDRFVMTPHGASTHDMNPSTSNETMRIGAAAKKVLKDIKYSDRATRFARRTDGISITSQLFGDTLLLVHDPSPKARDDLDEHIGKVIVKHARKDGVDHTLFVDAHNCIVQGSDNVHHHDPATDRIVDMAEVSIQRALIAKKEAFKVGFAQDTDLTVDGESIGPSGIQALVVEVGGQTTAYVLLDGNNILKGLTQDFQRALGPIVDGSVIMTSDNHIANVTMGGFNPIGLKVEGKALSGRIKKVVKRAIDDLEECEVGGASGSARVSVFGPGATARLTATINASMSVMKIGLAAALALAFTGTVVWYQVLVFLGQM